MFSKSINDTSRVIRMTIAGDATTWSIIIESSFAIIICLKYRLLENIYSTGVTHYSPNIFIVEATSQKVVETNFK
jgi:hypothetical protein